MVSNEDQTARANIRDCALKLFAERGPDAVTVRDIAACAGTSPALVLHHFGSKQGLRDSADEHVAGMFDAMLERVMKEAPAMAERPGAAAQGFAELMVNFLPADSPVPGYVRRLLLNGDPVGHRLFRQWFEMSAAMSERMTSVGLMKESADPDVRAAFLMVNDLALVLLHEHLAEVLGVDPLTPEGIKRWTVDVIDAYAHGVFRMEN